MMEKVLSTAPSSSSSSGANTQGSNSGRPIRFVYYADNGKFQLDPDAIHVLHQIKGPVAVVSVCGPTRQGKSFILNQLLGRSTGFQVASTHQPHTKGLWMWSVPLKRTALDGTEYGLLLLDSGGINAYDQTGMYNIHISSLAVLLSSLFIYNQGGVIDEAALDRLSLLTEMSKHIHGRASEGKDSISELGNLSPVFVWLLRDFYLDLIEDNTKITPRDYLELALRPVLGSGKDTGAKNQLDKFRPEFLSGLDAFTKFVYERTKPKQVGGTVMSGPFLADITKSFLDTLNNDVIPKISSYWQDYARDAFVEADLQCSYAIQSMEKELQGACLVADAKMENVVMVLEGLLSEYKASAHGPMKWQKLSSFLQKSLQGPILHHAKKLIDEVSSEKSSFMVKCNSFEHKIDLLQMQLQASEKLKAECQKYYEDAIKDFKKLSDQYKSRIIELEHKCDILEERCSSSLEMLDSAKQESVEWERKYEAILTKKRTINDNAKSAVLESGIGEAEARIAAAVEQSRLAWKEANEWKQKCDIAVNEAKDAAEKAAEEAKLREEALRAEFTHSLAAKDEEINEKVAKLHEAEQRLTTLTLDLTAAETKMKNYDLESSALKLQIKDLAEKYECAKAAAQSMEREAQTLVEDKIQLEQKYLAELKRFEEAHERCKAVEEEIKIANAVIETAQSEVLTSQNEKHDTQQLTIDRFAQTRSAHCYNEILEREKMDPTGEVERSVASEGYAMSKVASLEAMVRERDLEIELLKKKYEQCVSSVQILGSSSESEHTAHAEAYKRKEKAPSFELESMQERQNLLQQKLASGHLNESAPGFGLRTYSGRKRSRLVPDVGFYSAEEGSYEEIAAETEMPTSTSALQRCTTTEVYSIFKGNEEHSEYQKAPSADYTKLTVMKLRQELNEHGLSSELQKLKYPKKKDILALYKKLILEK
ncbi:hypothetical protein P3X46_012365 [Hevea brasiliensis]|uniref:GB1/RHD3-type G domain-containing protein n=1 Tax=Hevea brasiliensis TaxID=3981 RepID=A0ABQ9MDN8_HEVBR|nr:hypothetical protein P3X46_012365 [Hevea brasiliensis]